MITNLDHVVVLTPDLDAAIANYAKIFGRMPSWRAQSDGAATAIFTLRNTSLELMAPFGDGAAGTRVKAALDAQGEGIASIAFGVDDIAQMHRRLSRLGLEPEDIVDGESRDTFSGKTMGWKRTRAAGAATHGIRMFFLQRDTPLTPSDASADAAVDALDHIVVATPNPERAAALYGARLGLDMKLDRMVEALGTRFLFFRVGGLVFEIIHRVKDGVSDKPDKMFGLTWAVADLDASHRRLQQAGVAVSELRDGRKPGTRVFTVKSGTHGVPTLMIQQGAR